MATLEALMTAEEFGLRPDPGYPEELVRGRIVNYPISGLRHGSACARVGFRLADAVESLDSGWVLLGGTGVITGRGSDTVRGADVVYYSYTRLPKGSLSDSYGPEIPEIVFEVLSPSDRWRDVLIKVSEYVEVGVLVVVVLDPETRMAHVFGADVAPRILEGEAELTFPGILDGFAARVGRFFE